MLSPYILGSEPLAELDFVFNAVISKVLPFFVSASFLIVPFFFQVQATFTTTVGYIHPMPKIKKIPSL